MVGLLKRCHGIFIITSYFLRVKQLRDCLFKRHPRCWPTHWATDLLIIVYFFHSSLKSSMWDSNAYSIGLNLGTINVYRFMVVVIHTPALMMLQRLISLAESLKIVKCIDHPFSVPPMFWFCSHGTGQKEKEMLIATVHCIGSCTHKPLKTNYLDFSCFSATEINGVKLACIQKWRCAKCNSYKDVFKLKTSFLSCQRSTSHPPANPQRMGIRLQKF